MGVSATAQALWVASIAGEIILLCVFLAKRQYHSFPIFLSWLAFSTVSDLTLYWIGHSGSLLTYQRAFLISSMLDYLLQLGVLAEIALAVLNPARRVLTLRTMVILAGIGLVAFGAVTAWALRWTTLGASFDVVGAHLLKVKFFFAYLRLTAFALIAGFSQMLGITWRNHVIRLAGGLAFYSAVSVVVELTVSHLARTSPDVYLTDYHLLDSIEITSFIVALAFWTWSFVQKDAPRKEFTPQMQHFLVTISETAKRSRLGLTRSLGHK